MKYFILEYCHLKLVIKSAILSQRLIEALTQDQLDLTGCGCFLLIDVMCNMACNV